MTIFDGTTEPNVTCVLGMHRSGTSVATRLIGLLGADLGPEHRLIESAPDNPRGFFEHRGIVALNERLLSRWGARWDKPPSPAASGLDAPAVAALADRARAILATEFGDSACWAFKDPRTCLTLPFWQRVLPAMRYVFCLRNPLDVICSLERRDGMSAAQALYLWHAYSERALIHTRRSARTMVVYEDMLQRVEPVLRQLCAFLCGPDRTLDVDVLQAASGFVDKGLQHHNDSPIPRSCAPHAATAHRIYEQLREQGLTAADHAAQQMSDAQAQLVPVLQAEQARARVAWEAAVDATLDEIAVLVGDTHTAALVDDQQWARGRPRFASFIERDGRYFGPPPDDQTAIAELERARGAGLRFIVFAQPCFWWLDHFQRLAAHLRGEYQCTATTERYQVFALHPQRAEAGTWS